MTQSVQSYIIVGELVIKTIIKSYLVCIFNTSQLLYSNEVFVNLEDLGIPGSASMIYIVSFNKHSPS